MLTLQDNGIRKKHPDKLYVQSLLHRYISYKLSPMRLVIPLSQKTDHSGQDDLSM